MREKAVFSGLTSSFLPRCGGRARASLRFVPATRLFYWIAGPGSSGLVHVQGERILLEIPASA